MANGTFTLKEWSVKNNKRHVQGLYTPSTSYLSATPSEWVTLAELGLQVFESLYLPQYDLLDPAVKLTPGASANKRGFSISQIDFTPGDTKAQMRFWETNNTEVADAVDKSGSTFYVVFTGT